MDHSSCKSRFCCDEVHRPLCSKEQGESRTVLTPASKGANPFGPVSIRSDSPTQLKPFSFLHFLEQPSPSSKSPSSHSSSRLLRGQQPDVLIAPLTQHPCAPAQSRVRSPYLSSISAEAGQKEEPHMELDPTLPGDKRRLKSQHLGADMIVL